MSLPGSAAAHCGKPPAYRQTHQVDLEALPPPPELRRSLSERIVSARKPGAFRYVLRQSRSQCSTNSNLSDKIPACALSATFASVLPVGLTPIGAAASIRKALAQSSTRSRWSQSLSTPRKSIAAFIVRHQPSRLARG